MVYFARYDSPAIKVSRKRKRAIAKQIAKRESKIIYVGDVAEIVGISMAGSFPIGTKVFVVEYDKTFVLVSTKSPYDHESALSTRWHRVGELKLIKRGS